MTKQQAVLLLFVLIIIGGGVTLYVTSSGASKTPAGSGTELPSAGTSATSGQPASSANKTVLESLQYTVPNGNMEDITVACVVDAAGNIVDVTFKYGTPTNPESKEYLAKFNNSFKAGDLIGTKIGQKKLSRVGGASLTTAAFNAAIDSLATKVNG